MTKQATKQDCKIFSLQFFQFKKYESKQNIMDLVFKNFSLVWDWLYFPSNLNLKAIEEEKSDKYICNN